MARAPHQHFDEDNRMSQIRHPRWVTALAVALVMITLPSVARADHVALSNGDRLTGTVISVSPTAVTMDTQLAGRVTMKWSTLADVTASVPVRATLPSGEVVEGPFSVANGRLSVQRTSGGRVPVDPGSAKALEIVNRSADAPNWQGTMNAGLDVSRGNSETSTLSTNGTATRLGSHDRLGLFGTYLFSAVGGGTDAVTTARATRGGVRYDHDLVGPTFGFGFGDAENDPLQLLDLRTVVGGGAGAHLLKTNATQLNLFGGVSYAKDAYAAGTTTTTATTTPGPVVTPPGHGGTPPGLSGIRPTRGGKAPTVVRTSLSRSVGEFVFGQDLTRQLSDNVSLTEAATVFPAFGDLQDYRVSFDLSLSAQLNGWLQWNLSVADRYLHIPPAGGAVQNDMFISTGLGITFGHGDGATYSGADARPPSPRKP